MKTLKAILRLLVLIFIVKSETYATFAKFPISVNNERLVDYPAIAGNIVVWLEGFDIYGYNLSTKKKFLVCKDTARYHWRSLAIGSRTVVWTDSQNLTNENDSYYWGKNYDIYGFDLLTQREFPISTEEGRQDGPDIGGDIVVWRSDGYSIKALNLSTGEKIDVSPSSCGTRGAPRISGNIVVWAKFIGEGYEIQGYNLSDGSRFAIPAPFLFSGDEVAFKGNIIVWQDWRNTERPGDPNDQNDIYAYDLATAKEFPICITKDWQFSPEISGNIVVWTDSRGGVYGYNLSTRTEFLIAKGGSPAIDGKIVVWREGGKGDIYGTIIPEAIIPKPELKINYEQRNLGDIVRLTISRLVSGGAYQLYYCDKLSKQGNWLKFGEPISSFWGGRWEIIDDGKFSAPSPSKTKSRFYQVEGLP